MRSDRSVRPVIAVVVAGAVAVAASVVVAGDLDRAARVTESARRVAPPFGGPALDPFVCRDYEHSVAGNVSDASMTEISGMARGRRDPSVLWVHEDSGAKPDVHALSLDGRVRQTFRLAGVSAKDWEDMSIGPGPSPGVNYLYLGDIGDNGKKRDFITVHRVPEPRVTGGARASLPDFDSIRLRYPDGPANSEAMAVGIDGTIYVITKSKTTRVYMAPYPQSTSSIVTMTKVPAGKLGPKVDMSGADIRMDGRAIIIRGYRMAWTWPMRLGEPMQTVLAREPCKTPTYRPEKQGESIAFLGNDGSYTTTGEKSRAPIRHYTR